MNGILSKRQLAALAGISTAIGAAFKALGSLDLRTAAAWLTIFGQLFGAVFFDTPVTPYGAALDMSKFSLVFADEFDHGFDTTVWQGHYVYGANDTEKRDTAYWNRGQVSFTDDGCLVISASYLEDGPAGPNYYSYGMETNPEKNYDGDHKGYSQLYGYFEMRCILPKGQGLNPAFWLLSDGMWADDTDGGVTGCELDVFETATDYDKGGKKFGSIYSTVHVDAYGSAHRRELQGRFYADDPYNKFNTYGVEWNEKGYTFYVNGVETAHTDFGGVCTVPEYLIISLGVSDNVSENTYLPSGFIVDYVRAYQYKDKL